MEYPNKIWATVGYIGKEGVKGEFSDKPICLSEEYRRTSAHPVTVEMMTEWANSIGAWEEATEYSALSLDQIIENISRAKTEIRAAIAQMEDAK